MIIMIVFIVFAYILGSIPFGFLVGRVFFKKDIRQFGSGNIGATNTFRVLGRTTGIAVFFLDLFKGALPIYLYVNFFSSSSLAQLGSVLIGMAAIIGHTYSVFLNFSGGKGAATALGVILMLSPKIFLVIFSIWVIVLFIFRFISLASITAAVSFPVLAVLLEYNNWPLFIFSLIVSMLVAYKHRSNILRIMNKTEPKILS